MIHYLVQYGTPFMVKLALLCGTNVNKEDEHGFTPLHIAVVFNRLDMVLLLIKKGADLHTSNKFGTALSQAVLRDHTEIVKVLLYNKVDIYQKAMGHNAIYFANLRGNKDMIQLFSDSNLNATI